MLFLSRMFLLSISKHCCLKTSIVQTSPGLHSFLKHNSLESVLFLSSSTHRHIPVLGVIACSCAHFRSNLTAVHLFISLPSLSLTCSHTLTYTLSSSYVFFSPLTSSPPPSLILLMLVAVWLTYFSLKISYCWTYEAAFWLSAASVGPYIAVLRQTWL